MKKEKKKQNQTKQKREKERNQQPVTSCFLAVFVTPRTSQYLNNSRELSLTDIDEAAFFFFLTLIEAQHDLVDTSLQLTLIRQ